MGAGANLVGWLRARRVPCALCQAQECAELVHHSRSPGRTLERLVCTSRGETYRRVWIEG